MSGILEQIAANQVRIISLLEVIAGANGTVANIPAAVVEAATANPAKELTPGVDVGTVTDATTLDKAGLPWDSRIHAATKTTNADGTWKYARGVDREVLVPQVEAELRAQYPSTTVVVNNVATPEVPAPLGAPTAAATPGLPPSAPELPSIPVVPPAKVEFPVIADQANVTDAELQQTAAALVDKHGVETLKALLTLFKVPEGGTVANVPATHKYVFWQYASNDDFLRAQSVIS